MNLFQKLLKIQQEIKGLGKDGKSFGYQYVTGTKALEHIKPLMNEMGLLLKPEVTGFTNERQDYMVKSGAKSEILTKVDMLFTWIDCETGETLPCQWGANGQNDWEKGFGSALTYGERYFLLKFFHIATDEDDIDNPDRQTSAPVQVPEPPVADKAKQMGKQMAELTAEELRDYQTKINAITTKVGLNGYYTSLTADVKEHPTIKKFLKERQEAIKTTG